MGNVYCSHHRCMEIKSATDDNPQFCFADAVVTLMKFESHTCCVFSVYLVLLQPSEGRFWRFLFNGQPVSCTC